EKKEKRPGSESVQDISERPAKKSKKEKGEKVQVSDKSGQDGGWVYRESALLDKDTISAFLKKNAIKMTNLEGRDVDIQPILSFDQAGFPSQLHKDLAVFPAPTPIQSVSWPPLLKGQDLVGIAATGSGKTIAFGIPGLIHLQNKAATASSRKPKVLVLSPTRELAMQIQDQFVLFGKSSKMTSQDKLRVGMDAIVATPGRLIDLFEENSNLCDLSQVSYLVLDEADRMLDAGFEEAIKKIIAKLPAKNRQTVMFSATWPQAIQKMALTYLDSPIKITVGSTDLSANTSIEQRVEVLDPTQKETRLLQVLKDYHKNRKNRILIFALYKKEAARLEFFLKKSGYKVGAIHGDLSQEQRTRALEAFKDASSPLLIATDVAARGIDIPDVEYVINVTFPLTVEDYCHRIGRTGRAGALINVLKQAGQPVPPELMKFGTTVKKKLDPNYGAFTRDIDPTLKATKVTFDSDSD
ncbi:RNA-dependent ATPase, partial [Kappamyces sp. JEL0680]